MYDAMDRSAVKAHARRGCNIEQIAELMRMNRKTVKKILEGPVDPGPQTRDRKSEVDAFRGDIETWIKAKVPVKRMLELVQEAESPYTGGRSEFYNQVAAIRKEVKAAQQEAIVRFEGIPGEYCQVDWGEIRGFKFTGQEPATRYFFAARLKFSRVSYVEFTTDTKLETLVRCLLRAFTYFGGMPWVCVFDNMKTVTIGRDAQQQPIWNETFLKFMFELECHPLCCWPASGNQKGSVENLVGFVKSNFLPARTIRDDEDLARQVKAWLEKVNGSVCQAHGEVPWEVHRLHEAAKLVRLTETADGYGLVEPVKASPESLVHLDSNRYSVPVGYIGRPLVARVRRHWIDIYNEDKLVARHPRAQQRLARPIRIPEHYEPVFAKKPRAQVMLYRDFLMEQDPSIQSYIGELCFRYRTGYGPHILKMYALLQEHGAAQLGVACAIAGEHAAYGADYLASLLRQPRGTSTLPSLPVPAPSQEEVDRHLASYDQLANESGW